MSAETGTKGILPSRPGDRINYVPSSIPTSYEVVAERGKKPATREDAQEIIRRRLPGSVGLKADEAIAGEET